MRSALAASVERRWPKLARIPASCSDGQTDCCTTCEVDVGATGGVAAVSVGVVIVVGVAAGGTVVVVATAVVVGLGFVGVKLVVVSAVVAGVLCGDAFV